MIVCVDLDYFYPNNNSKFDYCIEENFYKQDNEFVDYNKLKYIKHIIKNKKIILLDTHDEILSYINKNDVVVNFDFHHDISYYKEDINNFKIFKWLEKDYKESCWAGYAIKYLNIDYYWIGDNNSYVDSLLNKFSFKNDLTIEIKTDTIYLIRSENYINEKQFEFVWRWLFG